MRLPRNPWRMAALALLAACSAPDAEPRTASGEPHAALETRFATLDGGEASIADLAGRVAVVNFWGVWCVPCRREIPELVELHERYAGRGVEVVGIAVESGEPEDIRVFMEGYDVGYTLWMTDMATALSAFDAVGYPFTLIVDRDGRLVETYLGPQTVETLADRIEALLE